MMLMYTLKRKLLMTMKMILYTMSLIMMMLPTFMKMIIHTHLELEDSLDRQEVGGTLTRYTATSIITMPTTLETGIMTDFTTQALTL